MGLMRALIGFGLGIVLFLFADSWLFKLLSQRVPVAIAVVVCVLVYLLPLSSFYGWQIYIASGVLLCGCVHQQPILNFLQAKPMLWLGAVSYSLYLLHIPIYALLQSMVGDAVVKGWGGKCVLLPCLLVSAHYCYHYFEQPTRRWLTHQGNAHTHHKHTGYAR